MGIAPSIHGFRVVALRHIGGLASAVRAELRGGHSREARGFERCVLAVGDASQQESSFC